MSARLATAGFVAAAALGASGADQPQWRGPARDGAVPGFEAPASWPEALVRAWSVEVGVGHASPVVVGDRVYTHAREGEREVVAARALATGDELWRDAYPAPYQMHPAAIDHGKGPKSTPVVSDGRIVTLGISGILSCYDAESGSLLWRRRFQDDFAETSPLFGVAMSPLVLDGRVIAHVGGDGDGALTSFALDSGETLWEWTGDGPAYASPMVTEVAGVRVLVTQTEHHVVGVDVDSGAELWTLPFDTPYVQNSVTPVVDGDRLYYSGLDQGLHAVRLVRGESAWRVEPLWSAREASFYMSTPVLHDGRLFGFSHLRKGQLVAVDAATGRVAWQGSGRLGENAAVLRAGGVYLVLTDTAELSVLRRDGERYATLASYTVADTPTWAHPALADDLILVKALERLTAWRVP